MCENAFVCNTCFTERSMHLSTSPDVSANFASEPFASLNHASIFTLDQSFNIAEFATQFESFGKSQFATKLESFEQSFRKSKFSGKSDTQALTPIRQTRELLLNFISYLVCIFSPHPIRARPHHQIPAAR
jgi:hypothetical protein